MVLMSFKTFFFDLSVPEREVFASRARTTRGFLTRVAYGKKVELGFADVLWAVSGGSVSHDELPLTENARAQRAIREAVEA